MIGTIPSTVKEALKNWDAGEPVFTLELGGLGPSYEQCIHVAIFESARRIMAMPISHLSKAAKLQLIERTILQVDNKKGLQLSGAQAVVARSFLYRALMEGWGEVVNSVDKDRHIQVMKWWPGG